MQKLEGVLTWSASDLVAYLGCEHATQLELAALRGEIERPERNTPMLALWRKMGLEHEANHLERLRESGVAIAEPTEATGYDRRTVAGLRIGRDATVAAMRAGVDVIYQGVFLDEGAPERFIGFADFLLRVETPSALGAYSYEIADTKLARTAKDAALMQMCAYSEQLEAVQKLRPAAVHVELGDGRRESRATDELWPIYTGLKERFLVTLVGEPRATYGEPNKSCDTCRWFEGCELRWRADDHLSLVANILRVTRQKLVAAGISTVAELAALPEDFELEGVKASTLRKIRLQAVLQMRQRETNAVHYELLAPSENPGEGLEKLPQPDPSDLFFDIEADSFAAGGAGLNYLFGMLERGGREGVYAARWSHTLPDEKAHFEALVDELSALRTTAPKMHVYHYGNFEVSALKALAQKHATRAAAVAALIEARVFVDLFEVVRKTLQISQESYSIKKLEPFYMSARVGTLQNAGSSLVAYEEYLERGDQTLLADLELYNRLDCVSTLKLHGWLEKRRTEARKTFGQLLARPAGPVRGSADVTSA